MDTTQKIQEAQYDFPYHHIAELYPFSETRLFHWGFKYAAYLEKVLDTLERRGGDSVLDVGCGDGKLALEISKRFPDKRIVGSDYSERSLLYARAFAPEISFVTSTTETFHACVMVEVIEHISPDEMEGFVRSVYENLASDGYLVLTTPHKNVSLHPKHYQHFSKESIEETLGKYFVIEEYSPLTANTWRTRMVQRLLANRFFILNYQPLVQALYRWHMRTNLHAQEKNATQVFVVARKRASIKV